MENIEIKVRVCDPDAVRAQLRTIRADYCWTRTQTDTYFTVNRGRLKLREESGLDASTLVAYSRPDEDASRISRYRMLPVTVTDAGVLKEMLDDTLGVLVSVVKTRELYLSGSTRIHLDEVDELGTFVELETVIGDQSLEHAWNEHHQVRNALGLDAYEAVPVSYSDLMIDD